MDKNQIKSLIREAFNDVTLESGTSILQTQVIDEWPVGYTKEAFDALMQKDITHDWKLLTVEDLDKCEIAHLDDKGFRYYIPALMCSVLDSYQPVAMRVIGTDSGFAQLLFVRCLNLCHSPIQAIHTRNAW